MPDDMYEVFALIPEDSDFTPELAVSYYRNLQFKRQYLQSELLKRGDNDSDVGIRVWYGEWSIVGWVDNEPSVIDYSINLLDVRPLPASPEQIAKCARRLCIWSDPDPGGDHSEEITEFTDALRDRFGMYVYDPVNDCWWNEE